MQEGKSGIICQARLSSTRLPGKVLFDLGGKNSIELIYLKYKKQLSQKVEFAVATSNSKEDQAIKIFCEEKNIKVFCGDLQNVLLRYYKCSKELDLKYIIRITSDCPFIDYGPVSSMLTYLVQNNLDYISNSHNKEGHVPDGFDIEVFTMKALEKAIKLDNLLPSDKEHVTFPFIKNSSFKKELITNTPRKYKGIRLTLDEPYDYKLIKLIIREIGIENILNYSMYEICDFVLKKHLNHINSKIIKNSGWESSFKRDLEYLRNKNN